MAGRAATLGVVGVGRESAPDSPARDVGVVTGDGWLSAGGRLLVDLCGACCAFCTTKSVSATVTIAPTTCATIRPTKEIHAARTLSFFFLALDASASTSGTGATLGLESGLQARSTPRVRHGDDGHSDLPVPSEQD